jgi:hypothetical protein
MVTAAIIIGCLLILSGLGWLVWIGFIEGRNNRNDD